MERYVVPQDKIDFYRAHGWVVLEDVVSSPELDRIQAILDDFIAGRRSTLKNRADLGGHSSRVNPLVENIVGAARARARLVAVPHTRPSLAPDPNRLAHRPHL